MDRLKKNQGNDTKVSRRDKAILKMAIIKGGVYCSFSLLDQFAFQFKIICNVISWNDFFKLRSIFSTSTPNIPTYLKERLLSYPGILPRKTEVYLNFMFKLQVCVGINFLCNIFLRGTKAKSIPTFKNNRMLFKVFCWSSSVVGMRNYQTFLQHSQ